MARCRPPAQRYWRGPVLHDFDGYTWRRRRKRSGRAPPLSTAGTSYRYEITLEPNQHNRAVSRWSCRRACRTRCRMPHFELRLSADRADADEPRRQLPARVLPAARSTERAVRGRAATGSAVAARSRNPRSVELAHVAACSRASSDSAFVDAVLDYLRRGGFSYTLEPPLLNLDSVDDLLFRTREGFCGHYASAFVMLMRAGGVPARVVTGYLGGSWNRYGGYLLHHASPTRTPGPRSGSSGRGWVRVDPTAVVAPGAPDRGTRRTAARAGGRGRRLLRARPGSPTRCRPGRGSMPGGRTNSSASTSPSSSACSTALGFQRITICRRWRCCWPPARGIWLALIAWGLRPRHATGAEDGLSRSWRALERKLRRAAAPRAAARGPDGICRAHRPRPPRTCRPRSQHWRGVTRGCATGRRPAPRELEQFRRACGAAACGAGQAS